MNTQQKYILTSISNSFFYGFATVYVSSAPPADTQEEKQDRKRGRKQTDEHAPQVDKLSSLSTWKSSRRRITLFCPCHTPPCHCHRGRSSFSIAVGRSPPRAPSNGGGREIKRRSRWMNRRPSSLFLRGGNLRRGEINVGPHSCQG